MSVDEKLFNEVKADLNNNKQYVMTQTEIMYKLVGFGIVEKMVKETLRMPNTEQFIGALDFFSEVKNANFLEKNDKIKFNALLKVYLEQVEKKLRIPIYEESD